MEKDFYKYLEQNGLEAYDKMAKEVADQLNAARQKYEENQKKEAEKKAKAEATTAKRNEAVNNVRDALRAYYGDKLSLELATICAKGVLEATDIIIKDVKKPKAEVVEDRDLPNGGHVLKLNLHDFDDLYNWDLWNELFKD